MSSAEWTFEAQRSYFSHDDDPETWKFRATTRPGLGLLERSYAKDGDNVMIEGPPGTNDTQWQRFMDHVKHLNEQDPENKQYKMLYVMRHGEGVHNVKEAEVGRDEWNRCWAKIPGDDKSTWLDAELTPTGEQQAREAAAIWRSENVPPPRSLYTSPLRRCLRTMQLAFSPCIGAHPGVTPVIKEKLRERLGVHTCDQRSSKSWIIRAYPGFEIDDDFAENDQLWQAERRETIEEHTVRTKELLDEIFTHDDSQSVALVAHSGSTMALFAATGWKKIPIAAGAVYPLLVCRSRAKKKETR